MEQCNNIEYKFYNSNKQTILKCINEHRNLKPQNSLLLYMDNDDVDDDDDDDDTIW